MASGGTRNEPATPTNTIAGGLTGSFLVPTLSVSGYIDTLGFFSLVDIWNRRSCSLADFYISMYIHRIRECPPSMAYGMKRRGYQLVLFFYFLPTFSMVF